MTSSCRTSRVILSAARGETDFSAPGAAKAATRANSVTGISARRLIFFSFTGEGRGGGRSVVARNLDECGFGRAVQHGLGVRRRKSFHLGRNVHGTEFRAAHRAKVGVLEAFLRQRLVVHGASRFRVERKLELAIPVEAVTGAGKFVVT